jgi:hypothetical protein
VKTTLGAAFPLLILVLGGCSLGQGEGLVYSNDLYAAECILPSPESCPGKDPLTGEPNTDVGCDAYNLLPDFFAAIPYRQTIQMRIQRGTDISELSDGLAVLVSDVDKIRAELTTKREAVMSAGGTEEEALSQFVEVPVAVPLGVTPPGAPVAPLPPCNAASQMCGVQTVAVSLYLQKSCHNQNTVLYAVSGWVRFKSLFSADPNEKSAAEKFTDADFDVTVGDPHDAPLGAPIDGDAIPAKLRSNVTGHFRFYFERGKPGQPFPG